MTITEWRPVVGYEGLYEVSSDGQVRSLDRVVADRRWGFRSVKGYVLKFGHNQAGHQFVRLYGAGAPRRFSVHRLVAEAFIGPPPEGMEVCHTDGDPKNNHVSNLRWDTHLENVRDTIRHGRNAMRQRTHCLRGHLLAEPNLDSHRLRLGHRMCLACQRAHTYCRPARHPERKADFQVISDRYYASIMKGTK